MRNIVSAGIGLLALAAAMQPASAADLEVKAPLYRPAPVYIDPWNWSGVYIGLNGGYSWGRSNTHIDYFNSNTGVFFAPPAGSLTDANLKLNGAIFGGQIGVNWQFWSWVGGLEADIQWSDQKGSAPFACAPVGTGGPCLPGSTAIPAAAAGGLPLTVNQKLQWFGTVRARVGVTPASTVLLYITGGLAYGDIKTDGSFTAFTPAGVAVTATFDQTNTRVGWTVGGGIEGRLWGNVTGKLEYLYVDLGEFTGTVAVPALVGARWTSRVTDNIFRAGINYKFNDRVAAKF